MFLQEAGRGTHSFLSGFLCHFKAIASTPQREAGTLV